MDMKGAYLNSYLSEKIYMKQSDGYDDGTGHVCQLIKTLYGLKQAGHKWNCVLDKHLQHFAKFMTVDVSNYITSFYGLGIFLNFHV